MANQICRRTDQSKHSRGRPWRRCDEAAEDPFQLRRPHRPPHLLAGDPRLDRRGAGLDLRPLSPRKRKVGRPDGRLDLGLHMALQPVAASGRGQQAIARPQQERLVAVGFLVAPLRPVRWRLQHRLL